MKYSVLAAVLSASLFLGGGLQTIIAADTTPKSTSTTKKSTETKKKTNDKKDPDQIGDRDVGKGLNIYSIEKEIMLGKQIASEVERQAKLVDDPVITEYVNRVGQNLVRNSDVKVPVTIKVIDSDEVNAFALPGGFFFVNTGLILKAESESELAGVMGHELAHIAARHGTRQASRATIANYATIPLIFLGGWAGYGARQAAGLLIPMGFMQFSRAFEEEADLLGIQYLYKAGYDPTSYVDFFEKIQALEKRKPGSLSKLFSSHPMTDDRIEFAQKNIETILAEKAEYVVTTSEFQKVKARLLAMQNRQKPDEGDTNRPRLKKAPGSSGPIEDGESGDSKGKVEEDERPTLKRRP